MLKKRVLYGNYVCYWLEKKRSYVKESTYAIYSNIIYNHIIPDLGKYRINKLNHDVIQNYIFELSNTGNKCTNKGLSDKTIKDIIIIIKETLKSAYDDKLIKYINLSFSYPNKIKKRKISTLFQEEQNIINNYIKNDSDIRVIGIYIALNYGLRIGEVCALKWEDIDLDNKLLSVNKTLQRISIKSNNAITTKVVITEPKTNNSKRVLPINKELVVLLKKFKTTNSGYVLTNTDKYIEPRNYRRYFDKVLKENNIKHVNFHALRHTFATNCIIAECDIKTISDLLGHANVTTTLNLYVHTQMEQKRKCIEKLNTYRKNN